MHVDGLAAGPAGQVVLRPVAAVSRLRARAVRLAAAGAHLPATIATAIGGAVLVTGGPFLMRWLREIMLGNRAGEVR